MSHKFIKSLIASSIIIIIALIAIQFYWIRNSFELKRSHFNNNVHSAIFSFAKKYERFENLYLYQNHTFNNFNKNQLNMVSIKSQIQTYSTENESGLKTQHDISLNIGNDQIRKSSSELANRYGLKDSANNSNIWFKINITDTNINVTGSDLTTTTIETPSLSKNHKTQLDENLIDSLLKFELNNVGINIDYEFVVLDAFNFPICGKFHNITKLIHSNYASSLYPNAIFGNNKFIKLYFPTTKRYLLKETVFILLLSIFLIVVIILIFYKAISTIVQQKQLSVIKNDFINNMTHELKTPIATISIACEALSDSDVSANAETRQNFTNIISEENLRLSKMVETVLKNATYEKSNFSLNLELFDIQSIINDTISNIEIQISKKGGIINKQFNAKNTVLNIDKLHIYNSISNILDNANKYSLNNKTEIFIETQDLETGISIKIKDNGIGIKKEDQQKIFEKFYRVSTGNIHDVKGFGLGLSYTYNIIKKHGGDISVKSEKNKGSEFTIFLPNN